MNYNNGLYSLLVLLVDDKLKLRGKKRKDVSSTLHLKLQTTGDSQFRKNYGYLF